MKYSISGMKSGRTADRHPRWMTAAALLLTCMLMAAALTEAVHAGTYSFRSTTIHADGTRTAKFTCNGMTGLCCEAGAYSTYSGTASLSRMKNSTDAAHCAYVYGYSKGWTSGSNGHKLARLLSYCMGHGTGGDYKSSTMKSLLQTAKKTEVPDGFECWLCKPKGSSKQDFIVWRYPKGKLKVVKKSAKTSISGKGAYNMAGMTIKVYSDAACKKVVKTLTTSKSGSTGGAFTLPVGTYYVKETRVPDSTGYKLNDKAVRVKVKSGSTASVTVSNEPALGSISIVKVTDGDGGVIEGFHFILTGKTSGKSYELVTGPDGTAEVTGLPLGKYVLTEALTEEQEKCYTDLTGPQTVTLAKGADRQHITLQRRNEYEPQQRLKIVKRTGDGGAVQGFHFRISWVLSDGRTLTGEDVVKAADPGMDPDDGKALGIWQIAYPEDLETINEAAAQGKTGTYQVRLRNRLQDGRILPAEEAGDAAQAEPAAQGASEKEASEQTASAQGASEQEAADRGVSDEAGSDQGAWLQGSAGRTDESGAAADDTGSTGDAETTDHVSGGTEGAGEGEGAADAGEGEAAGGSAETGQTGTEGIPTAEDAPLDSDLQAASDPLPEEIEISISIALRPAGEAEESGSSAPLTVESHADTQVGDLKIRHGNLIFAGAASVGEETVATGETGQYVTDHVRPGTYTVTEEMTDRQKLRYRQPEPQTVEIRPDSEESIVFSFLNEPIRIPVKLQKASADGRLEGVEFTLSGAADYAEEPMEEMTVATDEQGIADFGMLYPGSYIIEETGFDGARYVNTYPMEGRDGPAFAFSVTGRELTAEEIRQGRCLWLGGAPGQGGASAEETAFRNVPYVDLLLTKVDGVTRSFLPGAEFSLKDGKDRLAARLRIDADEDGQPLPVMLESDGRVTAEAGEKAAGASAVVGASQETKQGSQGAQDVSEMQDPDETQGEYPCIVLHGLVEAEQYTLTEEKAPEGFTPLEQPYVFTVRLNDAGEPVLHTCDEYGVNIDASDQPGALVIVNDAPTIGTVALDQNTGDHIADADEQVTLTDHCRVSNLAKGQTYTMVARLMDNTEYLAGGDESSVRQVDDGDGPVTGAVTFEASGREERVQVPIRLRAGTLKGRSTVIYESLYTGKVEPSEAGRKTAAAEEADPARTSQTVRFPEIGTTASMGLMGRIKDQVRYAQLLPNRTYVIRGWLMDQATGEAVPETYTGVSAETSFVTDASGSGKVTVPFSIDADALAGDGITDLVVFEECYLQKETSDGSSKLVRVAAHKDLTDRDQSVELPTPGTPATGDGQPPWMALTLMVTALLLGGTVSLYRRV